MIRRASRQKRIDRARRRRRSERIYSEEYLAFVKMRVQVCFAKRTVPGHVCDFGIQGDHMGKKPTSRKCNDNETVPLCAKAHHDRDNFSGDFKGWDHDRMRAWLDQGIRETQADFARRGYIDPAIF